jgi:outer membrane murein-binding lipoprotein Lpp
MSQSDEVMARLDRLEGAVVKISEVLVLQSQRFLELNDRVDTLNQRVDTLNHRVDGLTAEVRGLRQETHAMHDGLATRLDRLIAVTIEERTLSAARLLDFDRRLSKLEERVGV